MAAHRGALQAFPPRDLAEHYRVFQCPIHFKQLVTCVILDPSILRIPQLYADAATSELLDHYIQATLKHSCVLNNASAGTDLKNLKGITLLTEVGYDIRTGSHCGAGAPRFDIFTTTGKYYALGCTSPPPTSSTPSSLGWTRLRWMDPTGVLAYRDNVTPEKITDPIKRMSIVFDEAQDSFSGSNPTGLAVLDNIHVNTTLVGRGH